jgi:hypothetical protein
VVSRLEDEDDDEGSLDLEVGFFFFNSSLFRAIVSPPPLLSSLILKERFPVLYLLFFFLDYRQYIKDV